MGTLSSNTVWPFVVETGLSYPTGCNLCVNMCALVFSPWICGFGPFTKKRRAALQFSVCVCVFLCIRFMFCA